MRLLIAIVGGLLLTPATLLPQEDAATAEVMKRVREHCRDEWPNDYAMRARCEEEQYEAMSQVTEMIELDSFPREVRNTAFSTALTGGRMITPFGLTASQVPPVGGGLTCPRTAPAADCCIAYAV